MGDVQSSFHFSQRREFEYGDAVVELVVEGRAQRGLKCAVRRRSSARIYYRGAASRATVPSPECSLLGVRYRGPFVVGGLLRAPRIWMKGSLRSCSKSDGSKDELAKNPMVWREDW